MDRLAVVVHPGVHRADDQDIVDNIRQARQQFRERRAALSVTAELPLAAQYTGTRLGRVVVLDRARKLLSVEPVQFFSTIVISGLTLHFLKDCRVPTNKTSPQLKRNMEIRNSKKLSTGPSPALDKISEVE